MRLMQEISAGRVAFAGQTMDQLDHFKVGEVEGYVHKRSIPALWGAHLHQIVAKVYATGCFGEASPLDETDVMAQRVRFTDQHWQEEAQEASKWMVAAVRTLAQASATFERELAQENDPVIAA